MNTLATFTTLLLIGLASTNLFSEESVTYTGEKDITKLVVIFIREPFKDGEATSAYEKIHVFFIEEGKGLFVLKNKQITNLLENGNDISTTYDINNTQLYFAASDGIYSFNNQENKAEKYGTLTDNTVAVAKYWGTNDLYILTTDNVVYKVTEDGTKKEEITNVKDAQQIVLDSANNLYFVDSKKHVYVRLDVDGTVMSIIGLPANPNVQIMRAPEIIKEAVAVMGGKKNYFAFANGTSRADSILDKHPIFAVIVNETSALLYASQNNKIYEYVQDMLPIVYDSMQDDML
ncbi:uncharacterized protein LOC135074109 [Ostrinia nubilalis]|uniref:uncharacterized protein LOC135074109 n=1 Tax=Ostrinia nubilalis TaxID=29057 RepID=UPI0030823D92